MRVGLASCGVLFGLGTWAVLAVWAPDIEIGFFLTSLEPWAVWGIVGVMSVILATRLTAPLLNYRLRAGLAWFSVASSLIVLGGGAALVLFRIVSALAAAPYLPADIVASNLADMTLLVSVGLLCAAAALPVQVTSRGRSKSAA